MDVEHFLFSPGTILDVRSPGEFNHAHIPGSYNLPLFSDDERHLVGCCYKNEGHNAAVELGLAFVGPKLHSLVQQAKKLQPTKLLCWRGGMRSQSMRWLLETAGHSVSILPGGYKSFRHWVGEVIAKPRSIQLLGGLTGSGKTDMLHQLQEKGEQILDLEAIASHRGSSYGHLGLFRQLSQEQFENDLACHLHRLNTERPIWIEDESRYIGSLAIPQSLFEQMQGAPLYLLSCPEAERLTRLVKDYGNASVEELVEATLRIKKKLGGERALQAVEFIRSGALREAAQLILFYYDKSYLHTIKTRKTTVYPFGS